MEERSYVQGGRLSWFSQILMDGGWVVRSAKCNGKISSCRRNTTDTEMNMAPLRDNRPEQKVHPHGDQRCPAGTHLGGVPVPMSA